jgi:MFS transporter, SP family, sugar:H+ symporter
MGLKPKKPDDVAGSAFPAIIIGMFVAFGGVLFGYVASAIISPGHY